MHKAVLPRDDVHRLYILRKGRRGIADMEDIVESLIQRLEDYIKKCSDEKQYKQASIE